MDKYKDVRSVVMREQLKLLPMSSKISHVYSTIQLAVLGIYVNLIQFHN